MTIHGPPLHRDHEIHDWVLKEDNICYPNEISLTPHSLYGLIQYGFKYMQMFCGTHPNHGLFEKNKLIGICRFVLPLK